MTIADWVQTAAVLVSLFAALSALWIASRDRRSAARLASLQRQLDAAVRLAANLAQGGTSDAATAGQLERARMGAEALVLAGILGPERVPGYWAMKEMDEGTLRATLADPETDEFLRGAIEAQLAVNAILREIDAAGGRRRRRRRGR